MEKFKILKNILLFFINMFIYRIILIHIPGPIMIPFKIFSIIFNFYLIITSINILYSLIHYYKKKNNNYKYLEY